MSLMYNFRVASNTIGLVVKEVADAIIAELADECIRTSTTPDGWRRIAEQFASRWQFQHALGAL